MRRIFYIVRKHQTRSGKRALEIVMRFVAPTQAVLSGMRIGLLVDIDMDPFQRALLRVVVEFTVSYRASYPLVRFTLLTIRHGYVPPLT